MRRAALLLLLVPSVAWTQVPRIITYQGVLTDPDGRTRADSSFAFTFKLHPSADGEAYVWMERQQIATVNGQFGAQLGSQTPFPDSLAFDRPLWLSVQVDMDLLSPRLMLSAVPYALSSTRAVRADTATVAEYARSLIGGNHVVLGSAATAGLLTVTSNNIPATIGTSSLNLTPGLLLENGRPAATGRANNSPAIQLRQYSWNPDAAVSQENSWYIQNWGFSTAGIAGGVLSLVNRHQQVDGTFRVVAPFAVDEIGRTIVGYAKSHSPNYFGFWGEDFGQWNVILAGKTVVGWPENSLRADLWVTGSLEVESGLHASGDGEFGGTLRARTLQADDGLITPFVQTATGQKVKLLSGTASISVGDSLGTEQVESTITNFGYAFNLAPVVLITRWTQGAEVLDGLSVAVGEKTATGFRVRLRNLAPGIPFNGVVTFDWLAIGY